MGGLPYVVADGRTGFLVEGHDPADHADRLLQILGDARLQASFGEEAASEALRFTWDATTDQLVSVYDELLSTGSTVAARLGSGQPHRADLRISARR